MHHAFDQIEDEYMGHLIEKIHLSVRAKPRERSKAKLQGP